MPPPAERVFASRRERLANTVWCSGPWSPPLARLRDAG